MRPAVLVLVLLSLSWGLVAGPAAAQQPASRSVEWRRFDVDLQLQPDGSLDVTETQEIAFRGGPFQKGSRDIPTGRTAGIRGVSVAEVGPNGQPVPYARGSARASTYTSTLLDSGLRVEWWFPPTQDAGRTFVLRYTVAGATRVYPDGDQVQWKAVYANRDGPAMASSVTLRLPADAPAGSVRAAFYRYRDGDTLGGLPLSGPGEMLDQWTVRYAIGPLEAGVGAEVRAQLPPSLVAAEPPIWQADADRQDWVQQSLAPIGGFVSLALGLGILAGGGAILFVLWSTRGADPATGKVPPRLDRPPSDLPAPLAGTLVDEVADERDALAILTDLAERELVTLADEQNPGLVGSSHDLRVTLNQRLDDPRLRQYERLVLAGLLGWEAEPGSSVLLSQVRGRFAASIPMLRDQLHAAVTQAGLFDANPEATRRGYRATGMTLVALGLLLAVGAVVALGGAVPLAWLPGAVLAAIGLALRAVAGAMPRRTRQGALEAARWRAFAAHLRETAPRQPDGAASYLPYAVAFGVDRSFLRRLESVGTPPPAWYGRGMGLPGGGGVVVLPGGGWGGGWYGPDGGHGGSGSVPAPGPSADGGGFSLPSGNPQGWSDALSDLLGSASDAMASGGGSGGWSGGGFGGGGGGGGGSGGFE